MALKMYVTGGTLRDQMLGLKPKDMDFSVEAPSFAVMLAEFEAMGGTVWQARPEFLTVRGKLPGVGAADFVMCRKEGFYSDGRHPDTVEPGTVLDDLARRDFTVNAMARCVHPDMEFGTGGWVAEDMLDPFDGQGDLARMLLRCVGNPVHRFSEDSLRMVRALRFTVTRDFTMHQTVVDALQDPTLVALLDNVAVERVREEMFKAFACDTPKTLTLLSRFPGLRNKVFSRGLWLTPTLEK
jgi:tRNA nucleotidyltransferase (CCA-adding enzyme)